MLTLVSQLCAGCLTIHGRAPASTHAVYAASYCACSCYAASIFTGVFYIACSERSRLPSIPSGLLYVLVALQVLQLLADNPYIVMDEHFEGNEDRTEEPVAGVDVKVWGNVVAFVERLDDEHFKSLQVVTLACCPPLVDATCMSWQCDFSFVMRFLVGCAFSVIQLVLCRTQHVPAKRLQSVSKTALERAAMLGQKVLTTSCSLSTPHRLHDCLIC